MKEIPKTHDDLLCVKFDKEYFSFEKDLFLCVAYISPASGQSTCTSSLQLERDIARLSKPCEICVSGDLNASSVSLKDYISNDQTDKYIQNFNDYSRDLQKHNMIGCNQDVKINVRCRQLLELCKSANLRICKGRTVDDLCGNVTVIKDIS